MKPEFLESAEFYNRRYHNFSSRVIVPMSLLVVFLLGFATLAEKEMSLSTRATVEPSRILANIQSTSNNRMLVNHLEENKGSIIFVVGKSPMDIMEPILL